VSETKRMTVYSVRLPADEVERARARARREAVERGVDVSWGDLLREALRRVVDGVAVG
jgi:hypothetical protein